MWKYVVAAMSAALLSACGQGGGDDADPSGPEGQAAALPNADPFPSTYEPTSSAPVLITNAVLLTGTGELIEDGAILLEDGRIAAVGAAGDVSASGDDLVTIDAQGRTVTPGIIDIHSHLGVYPSPDFQSTADGNEATNPNTAGVWSEHSLWPGDPGFTRALAGGVTTLHVMPGSANLFGGRTVTVRNVASRTVQGMKFPEAPYGLKMACGENPRRVYANSGPATRMGNFRGYRAAWIDAAEYRDKWAEYAEQIEAGEDADAPSRDLRLETLAGVLNGEILVHMHCYRGDEMVQILDMADEFGYEISTFHHAVEAYKIADYLAENDVCAAVWADWWGFKFEAYDSVRENAALVHAQEGGCAVVHSDSALGIQRLNQEAAKAMADGVALGLDIPPEVAISWITSNPAEALGIGEQTGTLEVGKRADIVVWSGDPFSVYTLADQVFIDGTLQYDRYVPEFSPRMDFEISQQGHGPHGGAGQ